MGRSGQLLDTWYFSHGADGLDVEWESELVSYASKMTPKDLGLAVPSGASAPSFRSVASHFIHFAVIIRLFVLASDTLGDESYGLSFQNSTLVHSVESMSPEPPAGHPPY